MGGVRNSAGKSLILFLTFFVTLSIYKVHDDAKDKDFELEMAWVGNKTKGGKGYVELVPQDKVDEAERLAKEALNDEMED